MESRNWRLYEQHKYYVQRNISLLPVAWYSETVSVTGAVPGNCSFSSVNDNYSSVVRLLLLGAQVAGYGCYSWSLLVDSEHKNEISKNGVSAYIWFPNELPDLWLDS